MSLNHINSAKILTDCLVAENFSFNILEKKVMGSEELQAFFSQFDFKLSPLIMQKTWPEIIT